METRHLSCSISQSWRHQRWWSSTGCGYLVGNIMCEWSAMKYLWHDCGQSKPITARHLSCGSSQGWCPGSSCCTTLTNTMIYIYNYIHTWSAKHTTVHCLSSRLRTPSVSSWHHISRKWCSTSTTTLSTGILQAFAARRRKTLVDDKCHNFHMSSTTTRRSVEEPWPSSWQH